MPELFLTAAEIKRLGSLPREVSHEDTVTFFTLSTADMDRIPVQSAPHNRLGFAIQLCSLRYVGFCPEDFSTVPRPTAAYVARQIGVDPEKLSSYGMRAQTRTDHLLNIMEYLGLRKATPTDLNELHSWLLDRALEHDRPTVLLQMLCEKIYRDKILRPGVTILERLVTSARNEAHQVTFRFMEHLLTPERRVLLDSIIVHDERRFRTLLTWLRQSAASNSPRSILATLDKLARLKEWAVDTWTLEDINPNRLKYLAQIGRRSSNQALQRMGEERRYPILLAFLHQSVVDITDEAIDMFDRCLADAYARAGHDLKDFRNNVARSTNEKLRMFRELADAVLDPGINNEQLRAAIYTRVSPEVLRAAINECGELIRPSDDNSFDFLNNRYGYLRQFSSVFLDTIPFRSNSQNDPLLRAVELLRRLDSVRRRKIPEDAPTEFVPSKWRPYVFKDGEGIDRRYYELCTLWELRDALRSGDVWVERSRRYANPESYLIPKDRWSYLRSEICRQVQISEKGSSQLSKRGDELEHLLVVIDQMMNGNDKIRLESGKLVVSPLKAEEKPESVEILERFIDDRLPRIDLSDLFIEVDRWMLFSRHFKHVGGSEARSKDLLRHLYASILAQGCNLGLTRMAQIADFTYDQLAWCTHWYIREETLRSAVNDIVNFQYRLPLSQSWGEGILSSSDGQRFPASGKVRSAAALPKYFGYGKGVTFYTWTSDQFSQFGTKVISATVRDATYVLDEILDNETELSIVEHTTDTAGYTEIVFALFDLLGIRFSPRIRDLADQRLYRFRSGKTYPNLERQLKGRIDLDLILRHWDDLLRIAGSLKVGWVTASLFISKIQSHPRQSALTRALREYGRLIKTIFILRYLESEEFRRRINTQLNKGEALHALRRFLFFANEGKIRRKQGEEQTNQATCLNLITNAVVVWNTVYMGLAIEQMKTEGHQVHDSDLAHLSPARYEHINPYGKYSFDLDENITEMKLRPLHQPGHPSN